MWQLRSPIASGIDVGHDFKDFGITSLQKK